MKYEVIQIRKNCAKLGNNIYKYGKPYFCKIADIDINEPITIDNVDEIYNLGNVSCWMSDYVEGDNVEYNGITLIPTDRFTGIVNGDFYVVSEDYKTIFVCASFSWKTYNTVKEAEDYLLNNTVVIYPYDNKGC